MNNQDSINLKKVFSALLKRWPLFLFSVGLSIAIAILFLNVVSPSYRIKSTIIVKESGKVGGNDEHLNGLDVFQFSRNVDNEMGILRSFNLIHKTLSELHFEVSFYKKGFLKSDEIYNGPLVVRIDSTFPNL